MKKINLRKAIQVSLILFATAVFSVPSIMAQETKIRDVRKEKQKVLTSEESKSGKEEKLLLPEFKIEMPFFKSVMEQHRKITKLMDKELDKQQLTNILWAANGFTGEVRSTIPATKVSIIDVYLVTAEGLYIWNSEKYTIEQIATDDFRKFAAHSDYVTHAPMSLIFVADYDKYRKESGEDAPKETLAALAGIEAGQMIQNVNLACANMELVSFLNVDFQKDELLSKMNLHGDAAIIATQTIGMDALRAEKK